MVPIRMDGIRSRRGRKKDSCPQMDVFKHWLKKSSFPTEFAVHSNYLAVSSKDGEAADLFIGLGIENVCMLSDSSTKYRGSMLSGWRE